MGKFTVMCVGPHYPATASRYLFKAFEDLAGPANTFLVGPTYNDHYGIDWGRFVVRPHVELPREQEEWDLDGYIDSCTSNIGAPDLILIAEETYRTAIKHTDRVPTVLLSYDGWPNAFARREEINPTIAYTVHPYGVRPHRQETIPAGWRMLLPAACRSVHRYTNSLDSRTIDFILCATMYGKRPALCSYLSDKVTVCSGTVNTKEYVYNHNQAKTTYHNCCYQDEIKYRFFEAAAMGVVNISDYTRLFEEVGLVPDVHYLSVPITETDEDPYPNFDDILEQVQRIKRDRAVYRFIARNAYEWVMANHTYDHRAKTILTDVGMHGQAAKMYSVLNNMQRTI